jgi:hypothetical protein
MSDGREITDEISEKWERYETAREAKSAWTKEEKDAKADLLDALGYDPEDEKPVPLEVLDAHGDTVFEVRVGNRKGIDMQYLKDRHPDVYAESEKWTHPISIRAVAEN